MCVDKFTVVEGHGKALLGKDTAEKFNSIQFNSIQFVYFAINQKNTT